MSSDLALISEASRMLAQAQSLEDIRKVANLAQRAADYARAARLGLEAQNSAAIISREAEAKAGEVLRDMAETGARSVGRPGPVLDGVEPARIPDLGISHEQSWTWQRISRVPPEERQAYYAAAQEEGREVTRAGLLRHAQERGIEVRQSRKPSRKSARKQRRETLALARRIATLPNSNYPPIPLLPRLREAARELAQYRPERTAERLTDEDIAWLQALRDYIESALVARAREEVAP